MQVRMRELRTKKPSPIFAWRVIELPDSKLLKIKLRLELRIGYQISMSCILAIIGPGLGLVTPPKKKRKEVCKLLHVSRTGLQSTFVATFSTLIGFTSYLHQDKKVRTHKLAYQPHRPLIAKIPHKISAHNRRKALI